MPSPCGASRDCAILTGSIDQQKFHKATDRHLYHDIGILHGKVGTGFPKRSCSNKKIEWDDDSKKSHPDLDPPIFLGILIASRESPAIPLLPAYLRSFAGVSYRR
jgi:hypothetical protein